MVLDYKMEILPLFVKKYYSLFLTKRKPSESVTSRFLWRTYWSLRSPGKPRFSAVAFSFSSLLLLLPILPCKGRRKKKKKRPGGFWMEEWRRPSPPPIVVWPGNDRKRGPLSQEGGRNNSHGLSASLIPQKRRIRIAFSLIAYSLFSWRLQCSWFMFEYSWRQASKKNPRCCCEQ